MICLREGHAIAISCFKIPRRTIAGREKYFHFGDGLISALAYTSAAMMMPQAEIFISAPHAVLFRFLR